MAKLVFSLILLIGTSLYSQSASVKDKDVEFENFLYHIIVTSSNDPTKALYLADSVYTHSTSKRKQSRALLLTANILEKENREIEGIEYAIKALEIAQESKDYSFEARIYGFLSTQNRNIGFYDEAERYLNLGIKVISKLKDKQRVERYMAMANHELAEYAYEREEYSKAMTYINLAILSYKKEPIEEQRNFILATANQLKGRIYIKQNEIDAGFKCFQKAIYRIEQAGAEHSIYAANNYQSIGGLYLEQKEIDSAGIHLLKAWEISENSDNEIVKEATLSNLTEYYLSIGDTEKLYYFRNKHREVLKANQRERKRKINAMHHFLNQKEEENKTSWRLYTSGAVLVTSFFIVGTLLFKRKQKDQIQDKSKEEKEAKIAPQSKVSDEVISNIRSNLAVFEQSKQFLNSNISFPKLVSFLKTNTKYLNYYFKSELSKDYTTYINDLRIEYILERLNNNKAYRQYKISYLAKESGFSSHSTFSANFKRVTGFSPSEYIDGLKTIG